MIGVITNVEQGWSNPSGPRWWLQKIVILLADWTPGIAFLTSIGILLWGYMLAEIPRRFEGWDLLIPPVVVLLVLVILHVMIAVLLPLRWQAIRAQFHEQLQKRLRAELEAHYHQVLADVTQEVLVERPPERGIPEAEISEVGDLACREPRATSASIVGLYGK